MIRVAAALASISLISCAATFPLNPAADRLYYEQTTQVLLKPNKRPLNPDDIDYLRFRHGGAVQRDSGAKALEETLRTASADGNRDEALAAADQLLRSNFSNLEAHLLKAGYLYERGDRPAASFHEALADGILKSIRESGAGDRADCPIRVFGRHELDQVLTAFGVMATDRWLFADEGRQIEGVRSRHRTGRESTLYFEVMKAP